MSGLYQKHRPKTLDEMVGQPSAVKVLKGYITGKSVPHAILFIGESGCGKTTASRILKTHLNCADNDFREINCATDGGIDLARNIKNTMGLASMRAGGSRIWLLDEAHTLTKEAQGGLLKILEDTPKHVYFMLATTHEQKLIPTIRTRCATVKMGAIPHKALQELVGRVARAEKIKINAEAITKIAECSDGSARQALVILEMVAGITDPDERLDAIQRSDTTRQSIEIARLLLQKNTKWGEMAGLLKSIEEDAEGIRRLILGYARSVLLGGGPMAPRAFLMINAFRDNFFDGGVAGQAYLAAACYEVITGQ